jgi:hypothetical protein
MSLGGLDLYIAGQSFASLAALYTWLLAMLIGASASAEERALGTREWQMLQPYPFWKQWLIKVVTIGALALTLGNGLAAVMESAFPLIRDSGSAWPISMPGPRLGGLFLPGGLSSAGTVVVLIAAVSLYASSISSGGLRALLVALPFSIVLRSLYAYALFGAYRLEGMVLDSVYGASSMPFWRQLPTASAADFRWANLAYEWTGAIALIGFLALTLGLASRNHRSAEHGTARAGQMAWIAVYALVSGMFAHAGPAVLRWFLLTH